MTVLAARDLSVSTTSGASLLADVSISVDAGETVLVAGPSGSAKTTLVKALGGLLASRPNLTVTGSVDGPADVGFLFQNPTRQLVRRTVDHDAAFGLENRGVPREHMRERIDTWADRLDARRYLDRDVEQLSRGETAVVALLGSLVTDPALVFLDEPLAPLDHRNRQLVLGAIRSVRETGTTLVIAESDLRDVLSLSDRVLVLEDGRVTREGGPREHLRRLRSLGLHLPFSTRVALERGEEGPAVPLAGGDGA
ncbi:MAG: energy-coupling factor ABC transporter ATP-binding protein [Halanaeroarchaeum sp.]